ncbi:hypothetical protein TCON_0318 [Astathelohania contejeani]|uniref:Uncharacterized protein n=1 Tax=Astathelohania contejeani TaxID=164912 RepID=A0ABQ7I288_9MICR|nr:hypothetical protein TCON_0318 [Thelohania contejeani]
MIYSNWLKKEVKNIKTKRSVDFMSDQEDIKKENMKYGFSLFGASLLIMGLLLFITEFLMDATILWNMYFIYIMVLILIIQIALCFVPLKPGKFIQMGLTGTMLVLSILAFFMGNSRRIVVGEMVNNDDLVKADYNGTFYLYFTSDANDNATLEEKGEATLSNDSVKEAINKEIEKLKEILKTNKDDDAVVVNKLGNAVYGKIQNEADAKIVFDVLNDYHYTTFCEKGNILVVEDPLLVAYLKKKNVGISKEDFLKKITPAKKEDDQKKNEEST